MTATGFALAAVFLAFRLALQGEAEREGEERRRNERELGDELQIRRKCSSAQLSVGKYTKQVTAHKEKQTQMEKEDEVDRERGRSIQ